MIKSGEANHAPALRKIRPSSVSGPFVQPQIPKPSNLALVEMHVRGSAKFDHFTKVGMIKEQAPRK